MKKAITPVLSVSTLLVFIIIYGCAKKQDTITEIISLPDSTYRINSITKLDVNDFTVSYQVAPPTSEVYNDVFLELSTSPSFNVKDSILLYGSTSNKTIGNHSFNRLKQATDYYIRLSLKFKKRTHFSKISQYKTDSLILSYFPEFIERGKFQSCASNFNEVASNKDTSTKVFLNNIPCTITFTTGRMTVFNIPQNISTKKCKLRFERNGISAEAQDSVIILNGTYTSLTQPDFPNSSQGTPNALGVYGTCSSSTKGYILGGVYFKQVYQNGGGQVPNYILEFDPTNKTWAKKYMISPRFFEYPLCHYYNNSIYVIGGIERDADMMFLRQVKNVLKLDLATMQWSELAPLPFAPMENQVSFEINGEWYVGLGAKFMGHGYSTIPMKEFWKFNPTTGVWKRIADFPGSWQSNPTAFEFNGKGYLFLGGISPGHDPFGYYSTNFSIEFWTYDATINTWQKITLPNESRLLQGEKYCIVSTKNKVYFLTAQKRELYSNYYSTALQETYLEYDPLNNAFSKYRISSISPNGGVLKVIYQKDDFIYLQGDKLGYTVDVSSKTYELMLNKD